MPRPLAPESLPATDPVERAAAETDIPAGAWLSLASDGTELVGRMPAMACEVTVRMRTGGNDMTRNALTAALHVFADVARTCTRFDPGSALMRANAHRDSWTEVPRPCFDALVEAYRAHVLTGGRFDPRVLEDLVALGYDHSMAFGGTAFASTAFGSTAFGPDELGRRPSGGMMHRRGDRWLPAFRAATREVLLGDRPVDLGGIAKGLAVRWAAQVLRAVAPDHLVDAGGDCWCGGSAPGGGSWRVGVEEPSGGDTPVAVLELSDRACATSSTRVRHWRAGGRAVHHLIDPRTGRPGGEGLAAVTTVGSDPADAEVWAKVLFLAGSAGIADEARRRGLAALWVGTDHRVHTSPEMDRYVLWRAR